MDNVSKGESQRVTGLGDLPPELMNVVLDNCSRSDLLTLSLVAEFCHAVTIPRIYENFKIGFYSGDGKLRRVYNSLIELLLFARYKLSYVRNFSIYNEPLPSGEVVRAETRREEEEIIGPLLQQTLPRSMKLMTGLVTFRYIPLGAP
jgi:hypothetical protein